MTKEAACNTRIDWFIYFIPCQTPTVDTQRGAQLCPYVAQTADEIEMWKVHSKATYISIGLQLCRDTTSHSLEKYDLKMREIQKQIS